MVMFMFFACSLSFYITKMTLKLTLKFHCIILYKDKVSSIQFYSSQEILGLDENRPEKFGDDFLSPSPFTSPWLSIFQMPLLHLKAKYWYIYSTHSWTVLNAKQYLHRLPFCSMKPSAYVSTASWNKEHLMFRSQDFPLMTSKPWKNINHSCFLGAHDYQEYPDISDIKKRSTF